MGHLYDWGKSDCPSSLSRTKGFRCLADRVVGSHQASVPPGKEESLVMDGRTTSPKSSFERAAGADLVFDRWRNNSVFFLSHDVSKIGREFWRRTISIRF